MRRLVIAGFSAIVLFILFVVLCTFVRRPYEEVLIDRFGSLIPDSQQARIMYNWYFKLPTDSVIRVDTRLHLKTLPLQEFVTAKSEPVSVRTFAVWRIVDPIAFRQKALGSDQRAEEIMEERIRGLVGQNMGRHQLDEFFNTDPNTDQRIREIERNIAQEATVGTKDGKLPGLRELGIEIADVGFSRMAFPPSNAAAVYQRMSAELTEKARSYESNGLAEADRIRAEGKRKASDIRSQAIAKADQIRGQGDREALEILATVNQTEVAREFYQYWKSLDFLKSSLAKNTILVLSSDNVILRSIFQAPQPGNFLAPTATAPAALDPRTLPQVLPGTVPPQSPAAAPTGGR